MAERGDVRGFSPLKPSAKGMIPFANLNLGMVTVDF